MKRRARMRAGPRVAAAVVAVIAMAVAATVAYRDSSGPATDAVDRRPSDPFVPCDSDATCVGRRNAAAAATACRAGIEDLSGFGVRWRDPQVAASFRRFAWHDGVGGPITFSGDAVDFRSAAGDYAAVTYECDFDPVAGKALATRVHAGPMP